MFLSKHDFKGSEQRWENLSGIIFLKFSLFPWGYVQYYGLPSLIGLFEMYIASVEKRNGVTVTSVRSATSQNTVFSMC